MNTEERKKALAAKKRKKKILSIARVVSQVLFFIFYPGLFSQSFSGLKNSICLMSEGQPLEASVFVVDLLVLIAVTVAFGRIFCGWACAFGSFGDWLYDIGQWIQKKLKLKFIKIPPQAIPYLQKIKYLVLLVIVAWCFEFGTADITKYSPWTVFSLISTGNFDISAYLVSALILLFIMVGMVIKERFFCQFLCPLGAVFSLLPVFFKLHRNEEKCIKGCRACKSNCPVSIKLNENILQNGECINCGRCKLNCPGNCVKFPLET